jgi:Tol biopolymer transport system component
MKKTTLSILIINILFVLSAAAQQKEGDPAENLPPNIKRITQFGERADWSHDGKKILFVEKTYGDIYEVEVSTGKIFLRSNHFYHGGFTRALYLANGDILLSGSTSFDASNPHVNRDVKAELWVMDKSFTRPPVRLDTKCFEGPGVSRKNMKIAWTVNDKQYPDKLKPNQYLIYMADIVYENGVPRLANRKLLIDNLQTPYLKSIETQNFVPPLENKMTFSGYGYNNTDVMLFNIETGEISDMIKADAKEYDEPEGVFPDGKYTLVECDRQNLMGSGHVDLWKLKLDGSGEMERLTFFSDYKGYKASNPVVSDDGKFMAFQMARSSDPAGVGYGLFVMDLEKAKK